MLTVYAIPGLGTTEKLFSFLKLDACELKVLSWPKPLKGMSMEDYSKKFIDQIDTTKKFYLLGISFGGMISIELAHLIKPEKIILISSCKNKQEFPFLLRFAKIFPLYRLFSEKWLRRLALHLSWFIGFRKEDENDFKQMINSMPQNYLQNSIDMIINWDETRWPENCIHIHGTGDRLLTYNNVKADYEIKNGTHAMIIYKANEISAILNKLLH